MFEIEKAGKTKDQIIRELEEAKATLEAILGGMGDAISIQDRDLRVIYQNQAHKNLIGNPRGEFCYRAYDGKERVCTGCPVQMSFLDGKIHRAERSGVTDKGSIYVEITASPVRNQQGEIVYGVEVARDMTKRKRIEGELMESEERYRMLFESAGDAIFILETEGERAGRIVDANMAAADMHGYSIRELLGMSIAELDTPDAAKEVPVLIQRIVNGEWIKKEITHRRKDGTVFPVEISAGLLEVGNHRYILAFDRDITKRKQMEEKLRVLSLTDELTGLYNRRGFFTLIQQQIKIANRQKKAMTLLSADLDNLKGINDAFGHNEGDLVLVESANILKESFRESDIIARIGGDEFVVLLEEKSVAGLETLTARLRNNLETHNATRHRSYNLSMSVGMASFDPENPCSLDELMAEADRGMYEQKRLKEKPLA